MDLGLSGAPAQKLVPSTSRTFTSDRSKSGAIRTGSGASNCTAPQW
jgi:hypothetical protein